jgi:hypothetical protein
MELIEFQDLWKRFDKNISDNTRINKTILREILIAKPEKRLGREKIIAGFNLILPVILVLLILLPNIEYRAAIDFYAGVFMFGIVFLLLYYWSVRYYLLIDKIDFSNSIILIKKNINQLEKYKIRLKKLGFILIPFGMMGIFLMGKFPVFSKSSILPISLIFLVMIISIYYTFKFSIFRQFRILNSELEEVERLEKE